MKLTLLLILIACALTSCTKLISLPMQTHQVPIKREINSNNNETSNFSHFLRKFSLSSGVDLPLINLNNMIYAVQIFVGEKKSPFNLMIDTGSNIPWLPLTTINDKLFEDYYDCQASDGCVYNVPSKNASIEYAMGFISGQVGTIPISLGNLDSIQEGFILADTVKDQPKSKTSGLLGLGPSNSLNAGGKTFTQSYYEKNLISSPSFSLYLASNSTQSELTLGGINTKYQAENQTLNTFTADLKSEWWSLSFNKFSFGSIYSTSAGFSSKLVFDSGFSFMGTSSGLWQEILNAVQKIAKVEIIQESSIGIYHCSDVNWPNIAFDLIDENGKVISYDLEPGFYLFKLEQDQCVLPFQKMDIGGDVSFAVGQQFLRKYLAVYSYSPAQVQIVRSINAVPTLDDGSGKSKFPTYAYVLVGIGIALLVGGLIYIGYRYCKKRKQQKTQTGLKESLQEENSCTSFQGN